MTNSDRDQEIRERYAEGGVTAASLSRAYALSIPRIRQIVAGMKKPKGGKFGQTQQPISKLHQRLGRKVYDYRFDSQLTKKFVADKLGWSVSKLTLVERGQVDLTLLDIQDLTTLMKQTPGEFIDDVSRRS